jgi:hypothetical protein
LVEAAPVTDRAAERTLLPAEVTETEPPPVVAPSPPPPPTAPPAPAARTEELTKPATFHLPLSLLQRLRATCRLKNTTMVEFVRQAIEEALEKQRPTEEEIRRLLGA